MALQGLRWPLRTARLPFHLETVIKSNVACVRLQARLFLSLQPPSLLPTSTARDVYKLPSPLEPT